MPVPAACQAIADQIAAARKELEAIQGSPLYIQGQGAPHPGKPDPGMLMEAEQVEAKIRSLTGQFDTCLCEHGLWPDQQCTFSGTATFSSPLGGGHHHVAIGLLFEKTHHTSFFVDDFPPITVKLKGGHTATVTQTGGGTGHFHPATGELDVTIGLDIDISDPAGSLTMTITLSTKPHGSALKSNGQIKVEGSATAHGHGAGPPPTVPVTMTVEGTIKPDPTKPCH